MNIRAIAIFALGTAVSLASAAAPCAQRSDAAGVFPTRPIRFVIGFTPGGQPDITARIIAVKLTDTMTGRTQFFMTPPATLGTLVKDGKIRALAVTGKRRTPSYPDAPTVAAAGVPGFYWETWAGMLAPSKTPRAIIDKLNHAIVTALRMPDVQQRYAALGADTAPSTPAELDRLIDSEITRVAGLARKAGIKPQ